MLDESGIYALIRDERTWRRAASQPPQAITPALSLPRQERRTSLMGSSPSPMISRDRSHIASTASLRGSPTSSPWSRGQHDVCLRPVSEVRWNKSVSPSPAEDILQKYFRTKMAQGGWLHRVAGRLTSCDAVCNHLTRHPAVSPPHRKVCQSRAQTVVRADCTLRNLLWSEVVSRRSIAFDESFHRDRVNNHRVRASLLLMCREEEAEREKSTSAAMRECAKVISAWRSVLVEVSGIDARTHRKLSALHEREVAGRNYLEKTFVDTLTRVKKLMYLDEVRIIEHEIRYCQEKQQSLQHSYR